MAQKTKTFLIDDLDGTEAVETVLFSLDKVSYQIDLSKKNAASLRDTLASYIKSGRRLTGRGRARVAGKRASTSKTAEIRAWAREQGLRVSDRGRVPDPIMEQYEKAHS